MRAITVRNLDDEVHRALMERAHANKRSMEAEAREILTREVRADVAFPNVLVEFYYACREDPAELPEITRDMEPPRVEFE
ncbi:FitA-like ribbon-helix-helix domain-containing protein [Propioniferax innocua]|uniref:Antitoxin FitA-like ribbon-helix-helix domain-containing protein n=1 Tax=Propioniferax innocua TaxID=1753 RepID=A0A542ZT23_9ACTN|nr:hypothetical protein [Propioniferax innocua]TQL63436.1 hypothetical protein FB460_1248 [Propioniferax innocua]